MVRGTNKRIIEINDTQNPYFERAVLYLKDSQADSPKKALENQAQSFLSTIRSPFLRGTKPSCVFRISSHQIMDAMKLILSAAAGGGLTFLFLH